MIKKREDIFLNSTSVYCTECKKTELGKITADNNGVYLEKVCSEGTSKKTKIVNDYNWYLDRTNLPQEIDQNSNTKQINNGCPLDCGICEAHTSSLKLPIFSITNDCNLNCPICFTYNRPDKKYYKTIAETKLILENIFSHRKEPELINLTGGEPTLHPQLFDILTLCKEKNIKRVTMNTNGIKLAEDFEFAKKIKESGVQLVLSLDTLDKETSIKIHGKDISAKKKKVLYILEELDIPTTILCVCIKNINEEEVANIVDEYITKAFVKSITIQNMTYTGANGSNFHPNEHITIDEVEELISTKSGFSSKDFFPLGSYHPLCYSVAYYLVNKNKIIPLTKLIDNDILTELTKHSYIIKPDAELSKHIRDSIDRLWIEGEDQDTLIMIKEFLYQLYPKDMKISQIEQQEIAEQWIKMIYIHPHMDSSNFDIDRASRCGDLVPDEKGNMIPACTYNLIYRTKDERFWINEEV